MKIAKHPAWTPTFLDHRRRIALNLYIVLTAKAIIGSNASFMARQNVIEHTLCRSILGAWGARASEVVAIVPVVCHDVATIRFRRVVHPAVLPCALVKTRTLCAVAFEQPPHILREVRVQKLAIERTVFVTTRNQQKRVWVERGCDRGQGRRWWRWWRSWRSCRWAGVGATSEGIAAARPRDLLSATRLLEIASAPCWALMVHF